MTNIERLYQALTIADGIAVGIFILRLHIPLVDRH